MDSEIAFDNSPRYRVYKSGRIERLVGETTVPPSLNPQDGVVSKDVVYSPEKNLSLRIYLPEKVVETDIKLPVLIYFHGGGFIAHHLTIRAKKEKLDSEVSGIILIHPYFWGKTPIDELETRDPKERKRIEGSWGIASPNSQNGADDPLINVVGSESTDLSELSCRRVLVMVAGDDSFVRQGVGYAAKLEKSDWEGEVEVMETENEDHIFHLMNPKTDKARSLVKKLAEFINK